MGQAFAYNMISGKDFYAHVNPLMETHESTHETSVPLVNPDIPKFRQFDQPAYFLYVESENCYAELVIKADSIINELVARQIKYDLESCRPGAAFFVLVRSEGHFRVTRKARKLGATKGFASHLAAVAAYFNNYSLHLLGELYTKINKPNTPTRIFYMREGAMEWLIEMGLNRSAQN